TGAGGSGEGRLHYRSRDQYRARAVVCGALQTRHVRPTGACTLLKDSVLGNRFGRASQDRSGGRPQVHRAAKEPEPDAPPQGRRQEDRGRWTLRQRPGGSVGQLQRVFLQVVTPVEGIEKQFAGKAEVRFASGATYTSQTQGLIPSSALTPPDGKGHGVMAEYFDNAQFHGQPKFHRIESQVYQQSSV